METNGSLSILEKPSKRVPNAGEIGVKIDDTKLESAVINDGVLLKPALKLCNQSEEKVRGILKNSHLKQDEVFLMTLDGSGKLNIIKKEK